ncbi:MAG: VTT domain-containing protein [Chloroflexota bacterium]|nr:VTT domain-containing protein [Chloroflexota bacterium]
MKIEERWLAFARLFALVTVIIISIFIYTLRDRADELAVYGYPGIFLISLFTNATILLPAPGVAIIFAMGAVFNPLYVGIAAGTGGALGELCGYLAGFSGQAIVEKVKLYKHMTRWVGKNGFVTILILAALPNPAFDVAGVAAGALKMPVPQFLLAAWIGVTIKMILFACAGAHSIRWVLDK